MSAWKHFFLTQYAHGRNQCTDHETIARWSTTHKLLPYAELPCQLHSPITASLKTTYAQKNERASRSRSFYCVKCSVASSMCLAALILFLVRRLLSYCDSSDQSVLDSTVPSDQSISSPTVPTWERSWLQWACPTLQVGLRTAEQIGIILLLTWPDVIRCARLPRDSQTRCTRTNRGRYSSPRQDSDRCKARCDLRLP